MSSQKRYANTMKKKSETKQIYQYYHLIYRMYYRFGQP